MADLFDEVWEQRYARGLALNEYPYDVIVSLVAKHFPPGRRGAVLDLGCGAGNHSLFFARSGFDVTGVDVSEAALEVARARAGREHLTVDFQRRSFDEIDAVGGPFDLILDRGALNCLDYDVLRSRVMPALRSLLVPGGLMFSIFHSAADPQARDGLGYTRIITERSGASPIRVTFVDRIGIDQLFEGFELKQLYHQVRDTLYVAADTPDLGAVAEFIVVAARPHG